MKRITLTIFAGLAVFSSLFAQTLTDLTATELKSVDLSGKYVGHRNQFTPDRTAIMQSFQYEFELTQTGDKISGVSTIIKENGDYADIKLRGMIVGSKLYFEEYETVNENKDPNMVWCFKTGALDIKREGDNLRLVGTTDSYIPEYFIPCTGGTTDLTKVDNSNSFKKEEAGIGSASITATTSLGVSPDPFTDVTRISYTLSATAPVTLEVYDITGRKITTLENNSTKNSGTYAVDFSAKSFGLSAGVLIAKLTVDGQIYSTQMVQMK